MSIDPSFDAECSKHRLAVDEAASQMGIADEGAAKPYNITGTPHDYRKKNGRTTPLPSFQYPSYAACGQYQRLVHATTVEAATEILATYAVDKNTIKLKGHRSTDAFQRLPLVWTGVPDCMDKWSIAYFANQYGTVRLNLKVPNEAKFNFQQSVVRVYPREISSTIVAVASKQEPGAPALFSNGAICAEWEQLPAGSDYHQHCEIAFASAEVEFELVSIDLVPHWFKLKHSYWRCVKQWGYNYGRWPTPCADCRLSRESNDYEARICDMKTFLSKKYPSIPVHVEAASKPCPFPFCDTADTQCSRCKMPVCSRHNTLLDSAENCVVLCDDCARVQSWMK